MVVILQPDSFSASEALYTLSGLLSTVLGVTVLDWKEERLFTALLKVCNACY